MFDSSFWLRLRLFVPFDHKWLFLLVILFLNFFLVLEFSQLWNRGRLLGFLILVILPYSFILFFFLLLFFLEECRFLRIAIVLCLCNLLRLRIQFFHIFL